MRCSIAVCALVIVGMGSAPVGAQTAKRPVAPRIAFINVEALVDAVPGRTVAEAGLASEVRMGETRVRLAADSLRRAAEQLSRFEGQISTAQREAATLNLRARELQLEDMAQRVGLEIDARRAELQQPLLLCVQAAVEEVQRRDGWHALVDIGTLGQIAFITREADVTPSVLAVLQEGRLSQCSPR